MHWLSGSILFRHDRAQHFGHNNVADDVKLTLP